MFESLDVDKSGAISIQEFNDGLKKFDPNKTYSPKMVKKLFEMIDKDHNEAIDFDEWCQLLIMAPEVNFNTVLDYWHHSVSMLDPEDVTIAHALHNRDSIWAWIKAFSAATLAGITGRSITAPLERIKIME